MDDGDDDVGSRNYGRTLGLLIPGWTYSSCLVRIYHYISLCHFARVQRELDLHSHICLRDEDGGQPS